MASSVPNTVTQFLAVMTAALPPTAMVWFGTPLGSYSAPLTLQVIGVHTGLQEVAVMGPDYQREETYQIACQLTSFAGDPDFAGRMTEVYAAFELITVAIGNNPTLNSAVRFAQIGEFEYVPGADSSGMTLGCLTFSVACQVRISSLT